MISGLFLVTSVIRNNLLIGTLFDQKTSGQETDSISNQIIQEKYDLENELKKQGEMIENEIREQLCFENVQLSLTQAYQLSFSGDLKSANSTFQSAENALKDSIVSKLRSGQQLTSVSQNRSIFYFH